MFLMFITILDLDNISLNMFLTKMSHELERQMTAFQQKRLMIPKGSSEDVNRRGTDNTIARDKKTTL